MAVSRDPAFRTVRMRESYDLDAVDDFVDRVIDALEGKPSGRSLTPEKIEAQEFKVVRLREGYSMDDVDDWLDEAAAELRRVRGGAGGRPPEPAPHQAPAPMPEPSYEQVGVANHYGAPPAPPPAPSMPPPPVAYPLPEPQQPPPPPQYPQDPGFGMEPTLGPDTAFHQLDPALRALDAGAGYGAGPPDTGFHDTGFGGHDTGFSDPVRSPALGHHDAGRAAEHVATPATGLHHLEIWVRDLEVGMRSFGWLFERLGWTPYQAWDNGRSWQAPGDGPYVVVERSPDMTWTSYDRKAPGMNHLALAVPERWMVDRIVSEASTYGWRLLFSDQHPYAGGSQHYAAYLENEEGFEVEVVAP